jgi:hypothetical protein
MTTNHLSALDVAHGGSLYTDESQAVGRRQHQCADANPIAIRISHARTVEDVALLEALVNLPWSSVSKMKYLQDSPRH